MATGSRNPPCPQWHAWLATIGWGVLLPLGVVAARGFKQFGPWWYSSHVFVSTVGFMAGTVGVALGFPIYGWDIDPYNPHRDLGIACTALGSVQVRAAVGGTCGHLAALPEGGVCGHAPAAGVGGGGSRCRPPCQRLPVPPPRSMHSLDACAACPVQFVSLLWVPAKGDRMRRPWEFGHLWIGRAATVIAIADIYYAFITIMDDGTWASLLLLLPMKPPRPMLLLPLPLPLVDCPGWNEAGVSDRIPCPGPPSQAWATYTGILGGIVVAGVVLEM